MALQAVGVGGYDATSSNNLQKGGQPMATPNPLIRFHYEDYQSLPESMSARYELLDGDLL
jgi:hypothetical protein